jgi:putative transposase
MANQAEFKVRTMCGVLGVSASGFYAWRDRPPSARARADVRLSERIGQIHAESEQSYGMPRIRAELGEQGIGVGGKRIARLMRRAGLRGVSRRRAFVITTHRDERSRPAPDLVQRRFQAAGPNRLWVADMTYVPTWVGFIYLAVVLDVWSRRVVGWSIGEEQCAELVLAALNMALQQRKPHAVIHHSDQGSQYTSIAFGNRCREMGVQPSMGSVGDAYDNAMAESFFASLECELIDRRSFKSKTEARLALFAWIEGWYNPRRRHSSLGYLSPIAFERRGGAQTPRSGPGLPTAPLASGLKGAGGGAVDNPPREPITPA